MRKSLLLLAALALALLGAPSAHAIVYGEPDDEHDYVGSFVGMLADPETGQDIGLIQFCTGTLIDPAVVLSAAHCFVGLEEFGITDVAFTLDAVIDTDRDGFVDPGVTLLTGEPVVHERFGTPAASNTHDLAVFLLPRPVVGVEPADLPQAGLLGEQALRTETFVAVGYGATRTSRQQAWQAFELGWRRMMAEQRLRSVTSAWATFSMNEATGDGGTCFGDSGGPHLLGDVVVSITVTGDAMCKAADKTYRIDTPWAREFIGRFVTVS